MRAIHIASLVTIMLLLGAPSPTRAAEQQIIANLRAFFDSDDIHEQAHLVEAIETDDAYDRSRVSDWLHAAASFAPCDAGRVTLAVPLPPDGSRDVVVRVPAGYDPQRRWPLIYALHGMGGRAAHIIGDVEHLLGDDVDRYIIAAPDQYAEAAVSDPAWPPVGEHPRAWHALKGRFHIDSDRVFVMGYSRGGHASWTLGAQYAGRFAGVMPLAGTFIVPLPDALWDHFLPNLANTPVLCVWGAGDIQGPDGKPSPDDGIAGVNRRIRDRAPRHDVPLTAIELPDKGHRNVTPPADAVEKWLAHRRVQFPASVRHTFRHLIHSRAHWIEAHRWTGDSWGRAHPRERIDTIGEGRHRRTKVTSPERAYRDCLGLLHASIDGQQIRIWARSASVVTVWIGDGMLDWDQPVTLTVGRKAIFAEPLTPNLHVCLLQAARTRDYDRLYWAGLRVRLPRSAQLVTPDTPFPTLDDLIAAQQ